jgi:hypothetical protein
MDSQGLFFWSFLSQSIMHSPNNKHVATNQQQQRKMRLFIVGGYNIHTKTKTQKIVHQPFFNKSILETTYLINDH